LAFLTSLIAGILFGAGLLVSRMSDPRRVLAFLDIAGDWNPALAFTMAGAVLVAAPAYFYVRRQRINRGGQTVELPDRFRIDSPLIVGSAIFGIGWGLTGICPGPGLLLLTTGTVQSIVFIASVIIGSFTLSLLGRKSADR
jgi:uncharacterized membrane protein YedE/YeeE